MDPRVALASAYLSLSIPFGPNSSPISLDFGVHPSLYFSPEARGEGQRVTGLATPFGYGYSSGANPFVHEEELAHIDQMEALGPAFWVAYALTGGEPFEPYRLRQGDLDTDFNRMWLPDEDQERQFPQARLTFGKEPTLQILPGYEEALRALWGLMTDAE